MGTAALVSGLKLVNAGTAFALKQTSMLKEQALLRLSNEFELSKKAIDTGEPLTNEIEILKAWGIWYIDAIESVNDVNHTSDSATTDAIEKAQAEVDSKTKKLSESLTTIGKR